MAMMTCPECGKQISDQAVSCPNCGYVLSKRPKRQAEDSYLQSNRTVRIVTGSLAVLLLCLVTAVSFYNWGLSVGKKNSFVESSSDSLSESLAESLNGDSQQLSSSSAATHSGVQQSQSAAVGSGASQPAQESSIEIISERFHTYQGLGTTTYTVYLAEILNTENTWVGLSKFSMDLEDVDGKLLNTSSSITTYPKVAAPGEKMYIYHQIGENVPPDRLGKVIWHYRLKAFTEPQPVPTVAVSEISLDKFGKAPLLTCRLENTGTEETGNIRLFAVLRNADGEYIAILEDPVIDSLLPGEKKGTKTASASFYDYSYPLDSLSYEVHPYYNIFLS